MAEMLRRWTDNLICSARMGLNNILVDGRVFNLFSMIVIVMKLSEHDEVRRIWLVGFK